jgi:hypothetical protein
MGKVRLVLLVVVLVFCLATWGTLWAMDHSVASGSATATIRSKTLVPAWTETRPRSRPQHARPEPIHHPESYSFELALDGRDRLARYSLPAVGSARTYRVGQRVRVRWEEKGLPPISRRSIFILDMQPLKG